mmetsp:Transcript_51726/g.118839  ORF Transcript_51726/g.118839 Transcript_51726/m.118839 type:complete len:201 (-) Transcript_51726:566-1168(-)
MALVEPNSSDASGDSGEATAADSLASSAASSVAVCTSPWAMALLSDAKREVRQAPQAERSTAHHSAANALSVVRRTALKRSAETLEASFETAFVSCESMETPEMPAVRVMYVYSIPSSETRSAVTFAFARGILPRSCPKMGSPERSVAPNPPNRNMSSSWSARFAGRLKKKRFESVSTRKRCGHASLPVSFLMPLRALFK